MSATTSQAYDAIVIGAGHNGLTTAALLAARKRRVLVLEARSTVGGIAAGEEFHPGYRHAGVLHETSAVRPWVVARLGLERHGLARGVPPDLLVPQSDGPGLVLEAGSSPVAARVGADELPDSDHAALARYRGFLERIAPVFRRYLDRRPPNLVRTGAGDLFRLGTLGLALRRLGRRDMMEVLRIVPMPVADWLSEWFASDLLKAALAGPAVTSTYSGPRSPGSNANLIFSTAMAGRPVAGGSQGLIAALERAARASGVEIRTSAPVERLLLESATKGGSRVAGVEISGGERIGAPTVAASCDPKQLFLDLLPPAALSRQLEADLIGFRARGTTAKIHLALSEYPSFLSRPGRVWERVRIADDLDHLERAFDAVKYRMFSERPALDVSFPSVAQPELAPAGHHVASVLVNFAPFDLEGGWTETARAALFQRVVGVLSDYAPGIESLIIGSEVLTPADLAERYHLTQGHLFQGEHALDQIVIRPAAQCAGYATPIGGLYLCGSGSHPGGGLTCAPGALAAGVIP